ncbi:hypothetical protein GCM10023170_086960 [Phytohabitans houttuyneae]|uniref:Uncharacterized protein n=1 Tax=Phytohabitans houttuyneae TaxID=1076126 RepID=A0A6V8K6N6_9ACTN|nr:hypothetical protein Phou_006450 [Phytohabitans houttuyneae]
MNRSWIGASYVLGREVRTDEPYPHICGLVVDGLMTGGLRILLEPRQCAACAQHEYDAKHHPERSGHVQARHG